MSERDSHFGGFEQPNFSNNSSSPGFGSPPRGFEAPNFGGESNNSTSFGAPPGMSPGTPPAASPMTGFDATPAAVGSTPGGLTSVGSFKATSAPVQALIPSLVLGIVSVIISMVLTFGSHTPTDNAFKVLSTTAWLAAGLLGVSLLGLYFNADNKQRASGFYSIIGWKKALYWTTVSLLFVGIVWSAIEIGQWVGKL